MAHCQTSPGPAAGNQHWQSKLAQRQSGCSEGLGLGLGLVCRVQWVVWFAGVGGFGFGLGLGVGVARVLLVGQTVPDQ